MIAPRAWLVPVTVICLARWRRRSRGARREPVVRVASALPGSIYGVVLDEAGSPIDGVVISALGGATAFAVTDRAGQYQPARSFRRDRTWCAPTAKGSPRCAAR